MLNPSFTFRKINQKINERKSINMSYIYFLRPYKYLKIQCKNLIFKNKFLKRLKKRKLQFPTEPSDLKQEANKLYKTDPSHNLDTFWLWSNHKFPKYLWTIWGEVLKNEFKINYGRFLWMLGRNNLELRKWARMKISWEEYITEIINSHN